MFDKRSQCKYYCENHYDYGIPHFVPQQFCITVYVVIGNSLLVLALSVLLLLSNIICLYIRWVHIHRYYDFVGFIGHVLQILLIVSVDFSTAIVFLSFRASIYIYASTSKFSCRDWYWCLINSKMLRLSLCFTPIQ